MKLKFTALLILMVVALQSSFGQPKIDSLRKLLRSVHPDSTRHGHYIELTKEFLRVNLDSSLVYAKKAYEVAENRGSEKLLAISNYNLGIVHIRLKQPDLALPYCQQAKDYFLSNNDTTRAMQATNAVGGAYTDMSQIPEAIEEYYEALRMSEQIDHTSAICIISNNLAILELFQHNPEKAIELNLKSLEVAKSLNNPAVMMNTLSGLANSYLQNGEIDSSLAVRLRLINLARETGDLRTEAVATTDLAGDYVEKGDYELALYTAQQAEEMCLQIGATRNLSFNYGYQGKAAEKLKDYPRAISAYQKALELFEETIDLTNVAIIHKDLASLYEKTGKFDLAYAHLSSHDVLEDSLNTIEREEAIQAVKSIYENEKKAEENKLLTQKNETLKKERNWYLGTAAAFFVFLSLLLYLFNKLTKQKREIERNNQLKDKLFTIIAHDLRSPLIALRGIAKKVIYLMKKNRLDDVIRMGNEVEEAVGSVHKLLDNLLSWALVQDSKFPHNPVTIQIQEVVKEVLSIYQEIAAIKGIKMTVDVDENAHLFADRQAIATVLRNLVDNAIKFTEQNGKIEITASRINGHSTIQVKDTGTGMSNLDIEQLFESSIPNKKGTWGEKGAGLGLALCKELIEMNGGEIDVNSIVDSGTTFKVVLPSSDSF
ncbi:MAG: tetratricopeptide repeat protein [Bacteroidota bacterium]